jgi:O-antigen/teichoic acid export membrane protein
MSAAELSTFSLVQLLVMTAVMLQRAFFLSPALASQRNHGQSTIPVRWALVVSIPAAGLLGGLISGLMGAKENTLGLWFAIGFAVGTVALVQDVLRFSLLSRNRAHGAVASDALWLAFISLTLFPNEILQTSTALSSFWAATGLIAVIAALIFHWLDSSRHANRKLSIGRTWKMGKWSGLDAALSATANLAPMLITALVIGSEHAGTYRVLQSSLGPLNILSTSLITMFGLDSWRFVSWESLTKLQLTVRKAVTYMIIFAVAYIAVAELVIISLAELDSHEMLRISLIVAIVGIIGAATSPLSAASLALGYQKHGAVLRLIIVTFSVTVSLLGWLGLWLPWNDPIGTVTLFAATAGLAGWAVSYRRAIRVEKARVNPPATLPGAGRHMAVTVPRVRN